MATELSGLEPGTAAPTGLFNEAPGRRLPVAVGGSGLATSRTLWRPPLDARRAARHHRRADATTPPDITGVVTSSVTDTQAVVGFQTSEPATAYVTYSVGAACPASTSPSAALGTAHSVTLQRARARHPLPVRRPRRRRGRQPQTGVAYTVQTLPPTPDTQPPAVAIVQPLSGSIVAGLVTIEATASDLSGVASVSARGRPRRRRPA
ncbi:MAG: hypothetical protein R2708_12365 [Vicinamibacterales bacterium]